MKPASRNLRLHGDSQIVIQFAFLGMAVLYWIAAKLTTDPLMPKEVYGEWVVSIDAEIWAQSLMLASAIMLLGIRINGDWRWSPLLRVIGSAWHCITLSAFAAGAYGAPFGEFFVLSTGTFAVVHAWFVALNLSDLFAAIRSGHGKRPQ